MNDSLSFFLGVALSGDVAREWTQTPIEVLFQIFLIGFLVALNGFFVAAEFAIVKVRSSQLDTLLDVHGRSRPSVKVAKHVTEHLDAYLSATQLGITLSSLGLGWIGEPYLAKLLQPLFFVGGLDALPDSAVSAITFAIGFGIITFLHIVLGELMPKSLAIRKSVPTTLWVSRPLTFFHWIFKGPIVVLNGCANKLLKVLFKIDPVSESELLHSAEELRLLLQETEKSEEVTATERKILINALELNDLNVRDVLTPRNEVVSLDPSNPFEENLRIAVECGHTRFPLVNGHLDHSVGLIHIKDVLGIVGSPKPDLLSIKRPLVTVPEMMRLDDLLTFFLREQSHMAVVVDEFGGTLGIVTLDNVIEELVGDIQDEFDRPEEELLFHRIDDDEFIAEGTLPLFELEEYADLVVESPDVSTIGGYVTHLLGHLPDVGEKVEIQGYEVTVIETDGRSVGRVRFRRITGDRNDAEEAAAEEAAGRTESGR